MTEKLRKYVGDLPSCPSVKSSPIARCATGPTASAIVGGIFIAQSLLRPPEVFRPERHLLASLFAHLHHHIAALCVVEGGRHPGFSIQVLPACAGDYHPLAEERALSEDFLANAIQ